jgi:hypothetical protein
MNIFLTYYRTFLFKLIYSINILKGVQVLSNNIKYYKTCSFYNSSALSNDKLTLYYKSGWGPFGNNYNGMVQVMFCQNLNLDGNIQFSSNSGMRFTQNNFLIYDQNGKYLEIKSIGDIIQNDYIIVDLLPSTGLLVKYDPSIGIIYFGFGLLMLTTSLSYLPYTQIWIFHQSKNSWVGGITNRGKIQLEIEFENLIRYIEKKNKQQKKRFE